MSSFSEVLDQLRENQPQGKYGIAFEKLMVNFFKTDPVLSEQFDEVHRWDKWRYNGGKTDTGIDLVARRRDDGGWVAIQAKFYKPTTSIQKQNIDSFFEASGHSFETESKVEHFVHRYIISTTDKWSKNAEDALENQQIPTSRIGFSQIAESPVNWDVVFPGSEMQVHLTRRETFEPRPHQQKAIDNVMAGSNTHDRGKLIMACGTGKTFTALRLAEQVAEQNGGRARVLFLVPSIALLAQTLREWTAQARMDLKSFAVCSDNKASRQAEDIAAYDLEVPVSTNGKDIAERFARGKRRDGLHVVFSTYQSLPAVHEAQAEGLDDFDLVICDEAHRTTGVTLAGADESNFVRIHDEDYIKTARRLYMTATPRLFDDSMKTKAEEHSAELASMDDEAIYGPEFHRLGFGEAVDKGLLTDYRVLVMTVDEDVAAEAMARHTQEGMNLTTASAMIGAWNALAKRSGKLQGEKGGFEENAAPMRRTVAFAKDIKTSKLIAETYPGLIASHQEALREHSALNDVSLQNLDLSVAAQHVDGSMNAMERGNKIAWLEATIDEDETRILTNARCLSEGVDVPGLDSVIFFNPRNSMVDVVQSVGRVMRRSEGKDYGYIILPVAVPPGKAPSEALNDNTRFKVVWQILNALRAHDDRFNAKVNSIGLNEGKPDELPIDVAHVNTEKNEENLRENAKAELDKNDANPGYESSSLTSEQVALFSLEKWQEAIYTKLVDKVGTRTYWEDWADDVAVIAENQITRINKLLENASPKLQREFDRFVEGLRNNLNDGITVDDAISMLSQHLITAPVFNALFEGHDFIEHNPVAQVMERMVQALSDANLESETADLEKFYESVRVRASEVTSASGKQQVIKELYERFFRKAFKKQAEALGIVYTPVEIVDFILRAADDVSRKHFGKGLTDEGVTVLDPFAGTSTFMVRLLQSGLIKPEDLARKYASELFATEIMLLAYYVSAVNIETTYNTLRAEHARLDGEAAPEYEPFKGIALADTFQIHEDDDTPDLEIFADNNASVERQKKARINVIVGNPPYSMGQENANDNNANFSYPALDRRIEETYAANSSSQLKSKLYDSYLRAFRWATDRIGDQGVVAFVSNGGWVDGSAGDGVRLSMEEDFTDIYVFNLRGNQRTAGEQSRKEGGKVFGSGSRSTIAITIGIKDLKQDGFNLFYRDIGDYLSKEEKLEIVGNNTLDTLGWDEIVPDQFGDWINQRNLTFVEWPPLADSKEAPSFFRLATNGINTARDVWVYSYQVENLLQKIEATVRHLTFLQRLAMNKSLEELTSDPRVLDPTKIKWSDKVAKLVETGRTVQVSDSKARLVSYRPFNTQFVYMDHDLIERPARTRRFTPTSRHTNVGFGTNSKSSSGSFAALGTNQIPDYHYLGTGQFFPRFTWEPVEATDGGLFGEGTSIGIGESSMYGRVGEVLEGYARVDNVTDEIKKLYRDALGENITGDDIFHFVYGKLHDPEYRKKHAADLKKMLPHIETPEAREEFDKFAVAGRQLIDLHVNYEDIKPWPLQIQVKGDPEDRETWRVIKPKWKKKRDPKTGKNVNDTTTMIYNKFVTITGIPKEAEEYQLGSRSALSWIIERYQVSVDKRGKSGIVNDPNDWADEVGNPRYIVDLIGKVTRVAMETNRIVRGLEG